MSLKILIKNSGITQKDLSIKTGIPRRTIDYMIKTKSCTFENAYKISRALNMSLETLYRQWNWE